MPIDHSREKLLNMIVYFVSNTKKCYKTKLFKLLYFADFIHFKETGRSITGLEYKAWDYGPVPAELYTELASPKDDLKQFVTIRGAEERTEFYPKMKFDKKYFTPREIGILEKVTFIFKEADAKDMMESTHLRNQPWDRTRKTKGMYAIVDYELAFDDTPESLSRDVYEEQLENKKTIKDIYS